MPSADTDVIIVGGGIAGLTCARHLCEHDISVLLVEASGRIGGRLKTDRKDGFLLDRGYQVLQTAYPAAREELDYDRLRLHSFAPGAVIRIGRRCYTVADPLRQPSDLIKTMTAPVGTIGDRLRLVRLATRVMGGSLEDLFKEPEYATLTYLRTFGFSEKMINRFFIPFFGGVCLDRSLNASSRVFNYILRMFASGDAALPEDGMEEIPLQLAGKIPKEAIRTGSRVTSIEPGRVRLEDGGTLQSLAIVLATEEPETRRLLNLTSESGRSVGETCFYFACDKAEWHSTYLILNGNGKGPINNLAIPSMVSPAYAPIGKSLINVVVPGERSRNVEDLLEAVKIQLKEWYGSEIDEWQHLTTYFIPHALPEQNPPTSDPFTTEPMVKDGIFVCGEYGSLPAIQWALFSGKRTATTVADHLQSAKIKKSLP